MKKIIVGIICVVSLIGLIGAKAGEKNINVAAGQEVEQQEQKSTLKVKKILTASTKDFYLEPGTIAVEFTCGSYAYANTDREGNKIYLFDNGSEIVEFSNKKEFKEFIGLEQVIEVVTHSNKENANFTIEENETAVIVLKDESFISVMENGGYRYYPDVKGNGDNSIFEESEDVEEIKQIVNKYIKNL